jgi:hypothetical protein
MDIAKGEWVESELDAMITRRHDQRVLSQGERLEREIWQESVAKYNARQEAEHRAAWCEHFRKMRGLHTALADGYDAKLRDLENGHHENGHRKETA